MSPLDAATRLRLENVRYPQRAMAMDVRTILAAYDAQAARLAAVEADKNQALEAMNAEWAEAFSKESFKLNNWVSQCSDENEALRARLAAVEAERDQQTALVRQWDERDHDKTVRIAELERERDKYQALWCETARMVHEERQRATRLAALEQVVRDNQWLKESHGVTRANDLRPRGYCTGCHDKHPCDTISLLEDIEAALAAPPGESP